MTVAIISSRLVVLLLGIVLATVITAAGDDGPTSGHPNVEELGAFEPALPSDQDALPQRHQDDHQGALTSAELNQVFREGKRLRLLSRYEEAIEHFHKAAVQYRAAQDPSGEAAALTQLAEVFMWLADSHIAIRYYEQALARYRAEGDQLKQVQVLAALIETSWLSGSSSSRTIDQYFREGQHLLSASTHAYDVEPLTFLSDVKKAFSVANEVFLTQCIQRATPSLDPMQREAECVLNFTIKSSTETFQAWQKRAPTLGADYLLAAGALYQKSGRLFLESGRVKDAIPWFVVALAYHTSVPWHGDLGMEWAKDLYFLAEAHRRQGALSVAFAYFRQALQIATLLRTPEAHWVYTGLARTYADMGDTEQALLHYKEGLALLESVWSQQTTEASRIGTLAGALYAYRGLVALLIDEYHKTGAQKYLDEAFHYHERLRARALLAMLAKARGTRLGGHSGQLATEQETIRRQLARIHHQLRASELDQAAQAQMLVQLAHLRQRQHALQQQAAQQSPHLAQLGSPRIVTVEEVQSILDGDTVLLEYSTGPEHSILWAITHDQAVAYRLPGHEGAPLLDAYRKTVQTPLFGSDEIARHLALGQQLYQALVGSAERLIQGKTYLIIAPDGPLYYLPFEALVLPESWSGAQTPAELADAPFLLKRFRVTYVPSASILVAQRQTRRAQDRPAQFPLLAFGDPVYQKTAFPGSPANATEHSANEELLDMRRQQLRSSGALKRLVFSGEEVRRIADIWGIPLASPHINLRYRASVARVRELDLSQYRMLHFAVHGMLADEFGLATQPALVLSQAGHAEHGSGLLQLNDILEMRLHAELVVLSACNTGLGRLWEGEGIVGLTQAFLSSGASAVIVSLWNVLDQSTSLLMERFYRRLKQGQSKVEALRQAKLAVLQATIDMQAISVLPTGTLDFSF
jgi:CHAT domain-containing protein